jgi:hypothetical protein
MLREAMLREDNCHVFRCLERTTSMVFRRKGSFKVFMYSDAQRGQFLWFSGAQRRNLNGFHVLAWFKADLNFNLDL